MTFIREPNAEPISGYRLIEPLGSGGFGEVWKCEAPGGIFKAIKFVYGNLNSLDMEGARAEQEFKALNCVKEVRHPFVLSLDLIKVIEGELVIVMELADKSLYDAFVECQAAGLVGIPRDDLLRYLRDAAEALDHMIQKHTLQHLDIKPRNLFLISDRVKVADFGLVKHLEAQSGMLNSVTPLYAPPETFTGKISEHSDQYSLAIVYQEMLTGLRPFSGKNARQLLMQHTQEEPELRNLPSAERPIVARALSKDPTKRFPNCIAFIRALYTARSERRPEEIVPATAKYNGNRPRTMSETLEDFQLEQGGDEEVDLGAAPVVQEGEVSEVSHLGLTRHQPQTGTLRPTLIVGIGGFGRRAILELRCRFLDRFGDLSKIPMLRFLYVDPDPDAIKSALRGTADLASSADELYHLALQPIGSYRRRMLDQLNEWLPQEKLFTLPRSLQTQGGRALGRLAFVDHHLRLLAKIRHEVQKTMHPDALYQSVSQTGLALRDSKPRIYVIGAAGGGGSGMLADLGFGLRRLLVQIKQPDADVTALLFCGAPEDPATPKTEQGNVYATLTELNHFSDPNIPFTAQYGVDGPRLVERGKPYNQVYLLKLKHRSLESLRDAVAHFGSYLFHELTTPLGLRLENLRRKKTTTEATPFCSFGTYAVWFPRGLLLRLAGRRACIELLKDWQAGGEPTAQAEIDAACARALADPELRFEAICARIETQASTAFEGNLSAALTNVLSALEEQSQQSVAQEDMSNWVRQALARMQDWVGTHGGGSHHDSDLQKSRLSRALIQATQKVAEFWDTRLADVGFGLMEHPGRRLVTAEVALHRFTQFCQEAASTHHTRLEQQMAKTRQASLQLDKALENCMNGQGGFSLFGGRSRRLLRLFMDHLAAYSRQCVAEGLVACGLHFYSSLRGRLDDRVRELSFCRQRLRFVQENVTAATPAEESHASRFDAEMTPVHSPSPSAESYWDVIRESRTARLVLPHGEEELEQAAEHFLERLTPEQWTQLDQSVQDQVLGPLGGLHKVCVTSSDLARSLGNPVLAQLAAALGNLLPVTDVADVELSAAAARRVELSTSIRSYYANAAPLVAPSTIENQEGFLLVPASDPGKSFGEQAKKAVPHLDQVLVPGQADLMFCREQGFMMPEDLRPFFRHCRQSYEEMSVVPNVSPHARFDITDWVPLDP